MASGQDAELVIKLYELRGEETLRKARKFMAFDFNPKTLEELRAVSRTPGTEENAYWRQVLSYWEMSASLVLHGAVDPDLYLEWGGEGLHIYGKYHHFHVETEKESGNPFMKNTAALVEKYPAARMRYEATKKMFGIQ